MPKRIKVLQVTGILSIATMFLQLIHNVVWTKLLFSCTLMIFLIIALYCTYRIMRNNQVSKEDLLDYAYKYDKEKWINGGWSGRFNVVARCFAVPAVIIGLALVPLLFIAMLISCFI